MNLKISQFVSVPTSMSIPKLPWLYIVYILLFISVSCLIAVLACVPPVSRDALTHHLFIPKLYLQQGSIHEIPQFAFSYYPMNLDLLYLIPLYFKNDVLPKFIHFIFALVTSASIYKYLRSRINKEYALLGSLFFLTIPVIVRLSTTVYVDLGLICFLFVSLLYIFKWIQSEFQPRYLIISAFFCGLALGTKYNGLIGLFLISLLATFVYARYRSGQKLYAIKSIGWCGVFVVVALIVFSPWMIRNLVWTGNPVFPLYNNVFNEKKVFQEQPVQSDTVLEARTRMSHFQFRHEIFKESWAQIALIPFRVFFQGQDDDPKYFDGKLNPFLLILPVFAFWGIGNRSRQEKTERFFLISFSVFFLLYACAQTGIRIRYFAPIIPPLVALSMFGLYNIQTTICHRDFKISEWIKKLGVLAIVIIMLGLNAIYIAERFRLDQPLAYIAGKITRDEYIQAYRPEYACFQFANQYLSKNDKIFGLYIGNRGYYSDIPIDFKIEKLQQIAAIADSGKDISEQLHAEGFTHLLVNFLLFNSWVQDYSLHERKMLKEFFDLYTIKEFAKDGNGLLRIVA